MKRLRVHLQNRLNVRTPRPQHYRSADRIPDGIPARGQRSAGRIAT